MDEYYFNDDVELAGCEYIGEGHNGTIYRLADGRILKIYKDRKAGNQEYELLSSLDGNPHFPRVYECGINYMIRDFVGGKCLKDYIKENGLSRDMSLRIIDLMEEFRRLNFFKLDIRCKDIFVQNDRNLMIIDPKALYRRERSYPHRLMKGLERLNVLNKFEQVLKEERPDLFENWIINGRRLEPQDDEE